MSDKKTGFQNIIGNKKSKTHLIFIGLVVVALGAYFIFSSVGGGGAEGDSRLRQAPNSSSAILPEQLDPNYKRALEEADNQRISEARDSGRSALPTIMGNDIDEQDPISLDLSTSKPEIIRPTIQEEREVKPVVIPKPKEDAPAPSVTRPVIQPVNVSPPVLKPRQSSQSAEPEVKLVERPQPAVNEQLLALYRQQMAGIINDMDAPRGSPRTEYFYTPPAESDDQRVQSGQVDVPSDIYRSEGAVNSGQSNGSAMSGSVAPIDDPRIAFDDGVKTPAAGKILYAVMVTEANSDTPGPVVAKIVQGEFAGTRVIGNFSVMNDKLILEFNTLAIDETFSGKKVDDTISVRAVAVDTKYIGNGLATDVNRHLTQRVAATFATSFVSGLGRAISTAGQIIEETDEGQITQMPDLNSSEQLLVATGAAAGSVGQIIDEVYGDRPTTVKVVSGTPIGLLFLQ